MKPNHRKPKLEEMLSAWSLEGFSDPPPTALVEGIRDAVRRAFASHLALDDIEAPVSAADLEREVSDALTQCLNHGSAEALVALIRQAAHEITNEFPPEELTRLLWMWKTPQDPVDAKQAEERVFAFVQYEICRIAARKLRAKGVPECRVTPGDLLSELYIHLQDATIPHLWENRRVFYAMAGKALDRILIDMFRASETQKRKGEQTTLSGLDLPAVDNHAPESLAFWEAVDQLRDIDQRKWQVLHLRKIEGRSLREVCGMLETSEAQAKRDYAIAKEILRTLLLGKREVDNFRSN